MELVPSVIDELMQAALREAGLAIEHGDVPVGAVVARIFDDGAAEIVATAHNRKEIDCDPTAHAEVLAVRAAAHALGRWRLDDCVVVVTLEPCSMCAGAMVAARVAAVVFAAADPKAGALGSIYNLAADPRLNHAFEVHRGVAAEPAGTLLSEFFAARRR